MESIGVMIVSFSPFQVKTVIFVLTLNDFMISSSVLSRDFKTFHLFDDFIARFKMR